MWCCKKLASTRPHQLRVVSAGETRLEAQKKNRLNKKLAAWQKSPTLTPEQQIVQASLRNAAMREHPSSMNTTVTDVHLQATPSYKADRALQKECFIDNSAFECYLSTMIVDGAIYAPCCEVLFCSSCIWEWLKTKRPVPRIQQQYASNAATRVQ